MIATVIICVVLAVLAILAIIYLKRQGHCAGCPDSKACHIQKDAEESACNGHCSGCTGGCHSCKPSDPSNKQL